MDARERQIRRLFMAAGTIFRGWGFAGMIIMLVIYSICAFSRRMACVSLCVIAAFAALSSPQWHITLNSRGINYLVE
jgi:hypothetical protein